MKVQDFLSHHGLDRNPFAEEDADSDLVFKDKCIATTYHPAWDKVFGNAQDPSTSVVFGEKGSGKTALRLQMAEQLRRYNREHPDQRVFVIEYDDFNSFLDRFRQRVGRRKNDEEALKEWRLWDHLDAILSLGVTRLVDEALEAPARDPAGAGHLSVDRKRLRALPRSAKRDILLLAALYDQSAGLPALTRWKRLSRRLRFWNWTARWDVLLGVLATILAVGGTLYWLGPPSLKLPWPWAIVAASWIPALWRWLRPALTASRVERELRVVHHAQGALRSALFKLGPRQYQDQPLPRKSHSVERYELLEKLRGVLAGLGFVGITIMVDRVDEPHLLKGSPERMRLLIWPLLDNKLLTYPGLGFKLLLPRELADFLQREEKAFYERSRLDKQNLIPSLEWSGQSLYDVASDRLNACRQNGSGDPPKVVRDLFDPAVSEADLVSALERLRVPRHLFKFLHRLLVDHCASFTEANPRYSIGPDTFRAVYALYLRDLQTFDRGLGTV